jgi:hypothetical protein
VLASDREREATVLRLRAAHLEGRIETDEFEERVSRAEAARTRADLDAIEADLPERSGAPVEPTSGAPWFPGRRHFAERKVLDAPLDEVREAMLAFLVPPLERTATRCTRRLPASSSLRIRFGAPASPCAFATSEIAARSFWCTASRLSSSGELSPG